MRQKRLIRDGVVVWAVGTTLALVWKFLLEELVDPFLPGLHAVEAPAERWEFVVVASALILLSILLPTMAAGRLSREITRREAHDQAALAAFLGSPAPMFVTDAARAFTIVNDPFCAATGYDREALLGGMSMNEVLNPSIEDLNFLAREMCLRKKKPWTGPVVLTVKDGTLRTVLSITVHSDALGNPERFVGVLHPATSGGREHGQRSVAAG